VLLTLAGTLGVIYLVVSTPFRAPWALASGSPGRVSALAFSPDDKTLAIGSTVGPGYKSMVTLWDIAGRRPEATLPAQADDAMAFSPDSKTLAVTGGGGIQLWDIASRRQVAALPGKDDVFSAVAFSPDGAIVAVVSVGTDVQAWDVASHRKITATKRSAVEVTESPRLRDGFRDALWLWDLPGRTMQVGVLGQTGQGGESEALGFTLTGTSFPSVPRLRLWDAASHRQITALADLSESSLEFSPDGRYLAGGGEVTGDPFALTEVRTGDKIANLSHNDSTILYRRFSPDGRALAAVDDTHGVIGIWHVP
jgi:WD40 repeat protein